MGTTIHIANLQGKLYCSSKGYPGMLIMVEDGSRPENVCKDCAKKVTFKPTFSGLASVEEPPKFVGLEPIGGLDLT